MQKSLFFFLLLTAYYLLPTTTFAVNEVDLVWQGETYVPPFYDGLPLWSNQSGITFVAIPHMDSLNPNTLIYRWSKDGTVLGTASGINKRSLSFTDSVLSLPIEVKVDIFRAEGESALASASVSLRPSAPSLLVVEDNPLYGLMLNKVVGNEFNITEDEVTFAALPLFSSIIKRNAPVFVYTWTTNTGDKRTGSSVTYRTPEEGEGSSSINVRLQNPQTLAQPKEKNFLIKFNKQNAL